jgi:hypothetical protein
MPKAFALLGLIVAICLLLVFGADLSPLSFPFKGISKTMDVGFLVCGALLAYLSWSTFREQK